jgi:hypothetical protein
VGWRLVVAVGVIGAATAVLAGKAGLRAAIPTLVERQAAAGSAGAPSADDATVDARLLVVSVDGRDAALQAMQFELDHIGIPYTVVAAAALAGTPLSDGSSHGLWNGVILAGCGGAGGADAVPSLTAYLSAFHVRAACLYASADPSYGLGAPDSVDTRAAPLTLTYTPAGSAVFGWYATAAPIEVAGVAAALAAPSDAATAPLLVDGAGRAGAAVRSFPDGRELMLLTFDQAPGAAHSRQLMPGVASWVCRGVFVGEKRAFFGAQADDLFIGTVLHDGTTFRMSGDDLRNAARWQSAARAGGAGPGLTLTLPFNGVEVRDDDPLTQAARDVGADFAWVSHTFDHHRLTYADYARMTEELTDNDAVMTKYRFGPYDRASLVTPDVSGLMNAQAMQAAADWGIAQVVCDASYSGCNPPVPNTGVTVPVEPRLLMISRIPTNLYADVSTPDDWVAMYNGLNAGGAAGPLGYDGMLDRESDALLPHLLAGDMTPWMFHQANLRAYDGAHTLLTDLMDRLLAKYAALRVLPVVTLTMSEVADRMRARNAVGASGLVATIGPGRAITLRATQPITVPVTGARAANAESYGQIVISMVDVPAGSGVTIPLAATGGSAGATPNGAVGTGPGSGGGGCGCALGREATPRRRAPLVLLAVAGLYVWRRGRRARFDR